MEQTGWALLCRLDWALKGFLSAADPEIPTLFKSKSATILLTIFTTHQPATDLGYLLPKHPVKRQTY